MGLLKRSPVDLAISCALLVLMSPADAAEYDQIDLSSTSGKSLTLEGDHVTHIGQGPGIRVSGSNNILNGSALNIKAIADTDNGAVSGVQVLAGGAAQLKQSTILASGNLADGSSSSGRGSLLRLQDTDIIATGDRGRGVVVEKGAVAELAGGTLSSSGNSGDVLSANGAGSVIRSNGSILTSSGKIAYAVRAQKGAIVELTGVSAVTFGQFAPVFAIIGADTIIESDGVSALAQNAQGADIEGGRFVFSNGSLKAKGDAILIRPGSQNGGEVSVDHSHIASQTGNAIVLDARQAKAQLDDVQVTTEGNRGAALWLPGTDTLAVIKDSDLQTWGAQAAGVDNRAGAVQMAGGSVITHGKSAHGLYASTDVIGDPSEKPSASFDVQNVLIETYGAGSVGALARYAGARMAITDSQVLTHGEMGHGLFASGKGAELEVTNSTVTTQGASAYGVHISNNGFVSLEGSHVKTFADRAYALVSQAAESQVSNHIQLVDSDVQSYKSSALRVSGGSLGLSMIKSTLSGSKGEDSGTAVWVTNGTGDVKAGYVAMDAYNSSINGDIQQDAGQLYIGLHDQSLLDGAVRDAGLMTSAISIDRSSKWTIRGDSSIASLTNNGMVDFGSPVTENFKHLTIGGDLNGDGHYAVNTNLSAQQGDRLEVGGQVTGNNQILVRNSGTEPSVNAQSLTLVQSQGGSGGFLLANRNQVVDVGSYRYVLRRSDSEASGSQNVSRWSLVNVSHVEPAPEPGEPTEPSIPPPSVSTPKPPVTSPDPLEPALPGPLLPTPEPPIPEPAIPTPPPVPTARNLSTAASAAINSSAIATLRGTWNAERSTLIQRLGDARQNAEHEGVWIRSYGQKQLLDNDVGRHFSQHVKGVQFGIDRRIAVGNGSLILGGLLGYSHTNRRFNDEGSGKLESYQIGSYTTYFDDAGWYADGLLTLNRWSTRLDVQGSDGAQIKGHTRNYGAGIALEVGKRFTLDDGWFVEPQVQFSTLYASADSYRLSNGMRVSTSGEMSTQTRVGSLLGRDLKLEGSVTLQPYLKAGWTQDLNARDEVKTNSIASHPDGKGGGWYGGAGITGSVGNGHQIYADLETSHSSTLERPWALNIGYRLTW